jgi:23S rRNA (pseudouridine1915-N3)-methyltransferase
VSVVLDERGEALSSMELARKLEAWRDEGKREARFGTARQTDMTRSSALRDLPAVLWVRDLAASAGACDARRAIVRATSIANHPYHREG